MVTNCSHSDHKVEVNMTNAVVIAVNLSTHWNKKFVLDMTL